MPNTITVNTLRDRYQLTFSEPCKLSTGVIMQLWKSTAASKARGGNVPNEELQRRATRTVDLMRQISAGSPVPLKGRTDAAWPQDRPTDDRLATDDNSKRRPEDLDTRIWMQYLGALSLLGRVASHLPAVHEDRSTIEQALVDANVVLRRKGSTMYFEHASGRAYAAFEEAERCTYPACKCIVSTSTTQPEPVCPLGKDQS